jgi:hypothetical protein
MNMPTVELHCDTCAEPSFLYRLHGTEAALCAGCFTHAYVPESAFGRRQRRAMARGVGHRLGRSMAGCKRVAAPRR